MSTPTTSEIRVPRYPDAATEPTLDTWQDAPHNRWALSHVTEFVPTATIPRRPLDRSGRDALGDLAARVPRLRERLDESFTDALVVVRDDRFVGEYYRRGTAPEDPHLLMSVSKSLCGLVVGVLVDEGRIDTARLVPHYVPELAEAAYGNATVQQVLDMTVAVAYEEDYRDPGSEVRAQDRVAGWRPVDPNDPEDTYGFLRRLRASGAHGERFQYCSANTDVLAWIVESVTGERFADVVGSRLWQRLGSESDASVTVDRGGFAFANGGISCTARDLARVGQLMLSGGEIDGVRVVLEEWVAQTMAGGDPRAAEGQIIRDVHPNASYRNQWWSTGDARGSVYAAGIHGQFIWLDPSTRTVVVKFSSCPEAVTPAWNRFHAALFADICAAG